MKYIAVVLLIISGAGLSDTFDLVPAADTYTLPSGGCYGALNYMQIANKPASGHPDERAMMLWDLSEHMGATATSATLYINIFFQCPSGAGTYTEFYNATEPWDESWSGAHVQHGSTSWRSYHYSNSGWVGVDVSDLVQAWLDGTIENHGVVLQVAGIYPWTKFHSRETSANSPYLRLEFPQALNPDTWGAIKATF